MGSSSSASNASALRFRLGDASTDVGVIGCWGFSSTISAMDTLVRGAGWLEVSSALSVPRGSAGAKMVGSGGYTSTSFAAENSPVGLLTYGLRVIGGVL